MTARRLAFKILRDIEINKEYSNLAINKNLRESNLDNRDKALVTELVYGVIEKKLFINHIINKVSKIKVKKMSHPVKIALQIAVYEMIWLDSTKDYASINEAVNLIKKLDKRSSGFVNGVLRNISRQKDELSKIDNENIEFISIKYSLEKWIVEKLISQYGKDRAKKIIIALSEKPKMYIRINMQKKKIYNIDKDEDFVDFIISELENSGVKSKKSYLTEALEVSGLKNIEDNKLFRNGVISIQDISSMMVANVANPKGYEEVLDVCAAPGGKTMHIAEKLETGKVVSCDVFSHKLKLIENYSKRLGLKNVDICENNGLELREEFINKFDIVLVDAPCSGMGIVRRKPEIKYKKKEDISQLPNIQLQILENASKYVKDGGSLIYSTCTIFDDENTGVMMKFLMNNSDFELEPIDNIDVLKDDGEVGYVSILPDKYDMDGFFICKMKKK